MADRTKFALVWLARLSVAAVFVIAASGKLADPASFAEDIANYQTVPWPLHHLAAGIVPAAELVGAVALVVGWKRRAAAWMLGLLTLTFLVLIGAVIAQGIDVSCGCFGKFSEASAVGWPKFWWDVLLLAAIAVAAVEVPRPRNARG